MALKKRSKRRPAPRSVSVVPPVVAAVGGG